MPFLPPNQQRQSTEGIKQDKLRHLLLKHFCKINKKLCYHRRTVHVSVKILPTAARNKFYNKFRTNRSNDARGLQLTKCVMSTVHPATTHSTVICVIHRLHYHTTDWPWQNFLSTEFGANFQRKVLLFLEVSKFPYNTV